MRRLVLHVGSPKCGSTYVQRVLLQNRDRLAKHGITYPHDGGGHPGNGMAALTMKGGQLLGLFRNADTAILSHEDLFAAGGRAGPLSRLCRQHGVDVTVLVFLRPFSEFIYGDYSQFLKQRLESYMANGAAFEGRGFELFAVERSRTLTAAGFLGHWAAHFGTPRISAHTRIRHELGSILGDFDLDWEIAADRTNPSLRMEDCDRIATAINTGIPADRIRAMFQDAHHNTGLADRGRTAERTAWIEALFTRQNAALMARYGFDNSLSRRPATKDAPHAAQPNSHDTHGHPERRAFSEPAA